jgi:hypothetical protein
MTPRALTAAVRATREAARAAIRDGAPEAEIDRLMADHMAAVEREEEAMVAALTGRPDSDGRNAP